MAPEGSERCCLEGHVRHVVWPSDWHGDGPISFSSDQCRDLLSRENTRLMAETSLRVLLIWSVNMPGSMVDVRDISTCACPLNGATPSGAGCDGNGFKPIDTSFRSDAFTRAGPRKQFSTVPPAIADRSGRFTHRAAPSQRRTKCRLSLCIFSFFHSFSFFPFFIFSIFSFFLVFKLFSFFHFFSFSHFFHFSRFHFFSFFHFSIFPFFPFFIFFI